MEIFNTDEFSDEDFLEYDENSLLDDGKDHDDADDEAPKPKSVKSPKKDQLEDDEDVDETNEDDDDSNELEVLLPSGKSVKADKDTDLNSSTLSPKFFSSLVQALKEGGILEDVEDKDIKSQEDFFSVLEESIKAREFADLDDTQKEYLEALRAGIPHEEIAAHQRNIEAYNSITEDALTEESTDGEELRRTIIMNNFITKGIAEARAKKLVDKIFDAGEDVSEATEALTELQTVEKKQFEADKQNRIAAKKAQEKADKDAVDKLNKIVKDTKELIPGMQIPQTLKNNIIKGLTQPVGFTEDKRPLDIISKYLYDNPIDGRFKLAYILSVTDGMKKMDVLENKKAKRNAFKDLENAMRTKDSGGPVGFDEDDEDTRWNMDDINFL